MEFYKFHKIIKYQSKTEKYSTFATSDNFRTRIGYVVIRCDEGGGISQVSISVFTLILALFMIHPPWYSMGHRERKK